MPVRMGMRLRTVPGVFMRMLVMLIVYVRVVVLHRLMRVRMLVPLGEMQPHAKRHQRCRNPEENRRLLAQHDRSKGGAEERGHGKIGSGARCSEVPQRHDEAQG